MKIWIKPSKPAILLSKGSNSEKPSLPENESIFVSQEEGKRMGGCRGR
jgi:hypothetical protein